MELTIKLSKDEVQAIINMLLDHPARVVNPLIEKIMKQANEQLEPPKTEGK